MIWPLPIFSNSRDKGTYVEQLALKHLVQQGLKPVEQNISSRHGEIDLLMRDQEEWVFVEVRYRKTGNFGGGLESVNRSKCQKLIKTAEYYIQTHDKTHFEVCRFDIIEVAGDLTNPQITWFQDAFQADT